MTVVFSRNGLPDTAEDLFELLPGAIPQPESSTPSASPGEAAAAWVVQAVGHHSHTDPDCARRRPRFHRQCARGRRIAHHGQFHLPADGPSGLMQRSSRSMSRGNQVDQNPFDRLLVHQDRHRGSRAVADLDCAAVRHAAQQARALHDDLPQGSPAATNSGRPPLDSQPVQASVWPQHPTRCRALGISCLPGCACARLCGSPCKMPLLHQPFDSARRCESPATATLRIVVVLWMG